MRVSHAFAYTVGETVLIDNEIKGRVAALLVGSGDVMQYQVSWWANSESRSEWFQEWRLSDAKKG